MPYGNFRPCIFCLALWYEYSAFWLLFIWPSGFGLPVSAFQPCLSYSVSQDHKHSNQKKGRKKKTTKMYDKLNFYLITYIKKFNWKYLLKLNFNHLLPLDLFLVGLFNGLIFNTSFFTRLQVSLWYMEWITGFTWISIQKYRF